LAANFPASENAPNNYDGNGSFQAGRGGAGASGVIQIHIPDPIADIAYHGDVDAAFKQYVTLENLDNPVVSDRQDQVLALYAMPVPFTLMPFFSPQSQVQSVWIDTGLANLRQPSNGSGIFPDYGATGDLNFAGIDALGYVESDVATATVIQLTPVTGGAASDFTIDASGFSVTIDLTSLIIADSWKFNPKLLIGCDFTTADAAHEIVSADLASNGDLVLATLVADGEIIDDGSAFVIYNKFFGVSSGDIKDKLPPSSSVRIQFQGADGVSQEGLEPDAATLTSWTGENGTTFDDLDGKRFIRYRVSFDIDALSQGGFNGLSRPALGYIKIPYAW
jgi:hypothetical protein